MSKPGHCIQCGKPVSKSFDPFQQFCSDECLDAEYAEAMGWSYEKLQREREKAALHPRHPADRGGCVHCGSPEGGYVVGGGEACADCYEEAVFAQYPEMNPKGIRSFDTHFAIIAEAFRLDKEVRCAGGNTEDVIIAAFDRLHLGEIKGDALDRWVKSYEAAMKQARSRARSNMAGQPQQAAKLLRMNRKQLDSIIARGGKAVGAAKRELARRAKKRKK